MDEHTIVDRATNETLAVQRNYVYVPAFRLLLTDSFMPLYSFSNMPVIMRTRDFIFATLKSDN